MMSCLLLAMKGHDFCLAGTHLFLHVWANGGTTQQGSEGSLWPTIAKNSGLSLKPCKVLSFSSSH
jgi:hypothetical protein